MKKPEDNHWFSRKPTIPASLLWHGTPMRRRISSDRILTNTAVFISSQKGAFQGRIDETDLVLATSLEVFIGRWEEWIINLETEVGFHVACTMIRHYTMVGNKGINMMTHFDSCRWRTFARQLMKYQFPNIPDSEHFGTLHSSDYDAQRWELADVLNRCQTQVVDDWISQSNGE